MSEVFVDTFFWLAMLNRHDLHHQQAVQMARPVRMVTTRAVQLEVMDAFSVPALRKLAVQFWRETNDGKDLLVIPLSDDLLSRAAAFFEKHSDKAWSMTDCISFVVMRERKIRDALTGDHHFEQAGFRILFK